ncbi:T9SS C-terminal target domain-containing protein [bacterium]|nr:MAG: T9SS C-terminal target domain-containing protein [bacterium]
MFEHSPVQYSSHSKAPLQHARAANTIVSLLDCCASQLILDSNYANDESQYGEEKNMKKLIAFCLCLTLFAVSAFAGVSADIARLEAELTVATTPAQVKMIKAELDGLYLIEPPAIRQSALDDAPANDLCENAIAVAIGSTIAGSTLEATADNAGYCGTSNTAPGVWYSVIGNGGIMTASTCNDADYDTKISVYTDGCGTLTCVAGNDDDPNCSGCTSSASWPSNSDFEYLVLVHGYSSNVGNFNLTISSEDPPEPPANDNCEDAIALEIPSITQGNSDNATADDVEQCGGYMTDMLGVWFTFVGNGHELVLTTCDAGTSYDTQIQVYTGECGELVCVGGDDDDPDCSYNGLLTTLTFCAESGVVYHVLLNGYSGATGDYVLHIEDTGNSCNCIAPDELPLTIYGDLPFCSCVYVCGDQPMTICLGPLGQHERPDQFSITSGCALDPYRVPESGCDDDACTPVTPDPISDWIYDADNSRWCMAFVSANDGCFCFCLDRVLPVELNSFAAIAGDRTVTLNWTTASETDNDYFDIVREGAVVGRVNASNEATGSSYSWSENNLVNGQEYSYTLYAVSLSGLREAIATASATPAYSQAAVADYALHQNFPNPFNPETSISFDLPESELVKLTVSNALGQTVATLVNSSMNAGNHTVTFEAGDMPSGLYFYRLEAGDFSAVRKMILMK